MDFVLSDEQLMLQDMLRKYLRTSYDFDRRKERLAAGQGRDPALWQDLSQNLGILSATLPESVGGLGGGAIEAMVIQEALGEALVAEPYIEAIVIASGLLAQLGGQDALLSQIGSGETLVVPAFDERHNRYNPAAITTSAQRDGDHWILNGEKLAVVAAASADFFLISAQSGDGISLFLVPSAGIARQDYRLVDGRSASDLTLNNLRLPSDALLGQAGQALSHITRFIDAGTAALCAEAVGIMRRMFEDTVAYCRERRQFGAPLASFQVLQHRMVDMYMALEQAVSASYLATLKSNSAPDERARAVSAAKAVIAQSIRFIGQNAVQLHGAMGMTEELPVGHYFRRATVIERQFGDLDHHLSRYAQLRAAA